jgi:hypothetical protein
MKAILAAIFLLNVSGKQQRPDPDKEISIVQKWELPAALTEISAITDIGNNRFACIMDEKGIIFIYNTATSKIEKEIPFTGNGDFEGIAVVNTTCYALKADGNIYEVKNYLGKKPVVVEHHTRFSRRQNTEGLCYDQKGNRLLMTIKHKDPASDSSRGIYAFDLRTKRLSNRPLLKIDLYHELWKDEQGKYSFEPADLAIHPVSGDIYLLDGEIPKLLIMGRDGSYKKLYWLDRKHFPLPEGISFAKNGELYVSNEGRTGNGTILKLKILK